MNMPAQLWVYQAQLDPMKGAKAVHDADSQYYMIDCGFSFSFHRLCRLARVNAPEIKTEEGKAAQKFAQAWLASSEPWPFILISRILDNYGRPLVEVYRRSDGANLSDALLASNNAVVYQ